MKAGETVSLRFGAIWCYIVCILSISTGSAEAMWGSGGFFSIKRLSISESGAQGNQGSTESLISANGQFVVFQSDASNLVAGDTNGFQDLFMKDVYSGVVKRITTSSTGVETNDASQSPSLSADGRIVAFQSGASNLVPGDTNMFHDVFVKDTQTGITTRTSTDNTGAQGNENSASPSLSANGQLMAFSSHASNLSSGDTNLSYDIFIKNLQSGAVQRVSTTRTGGEALQNSTVPSLSADGRTVAFQSDAPNLVPGDTNGRTDVFVKNIQSGEISRVSTNTSGTQGNENTYSPSLSADGRIIAFQSDASNLVPSDTNGKTDVFVKNIQSGEISRVSTNTSGTQGNENTYSPSLSADGRIIAFQSDASNLVPSDTNGKTDVFVKDTQTGITTRASTDNTGAQGNDNTYLPSLSADGNSVAFDSHASNLVPDDTNMFADVFVKSWHDDSTDNPLGDKASADTISLIGEEHPSSPPNLPSVFSGFSDLNVGIANNRVMASGKLSCQPSSALCAGTVSLTFKEKAGSKRKRKLNALQLVSDARVSGHNSQKVVLDTKSKKAVKWMKELVDKYVVISVTVQDINHSHKPVTTKQTVRVHKLQNKKSRT